MVDCESNMEKSTLELIENGLRGHPLENLIDGWTFSVNESSSNLYIVKGINGQGKNISSFGVDPEKALKDCLKKAAQLNSRQKFIAKLKKLLSI